MFDRDDFDKDFRSTRRIVVATFFVSAVVAIGMISFGAWVIVKVMAHLGII